MLIIVAYISSFVYLRNKIYLSDSRYSELCQKSFFFPWKMDARHFYDLEFMLILGEINYQYFNVQKLKSEGRAF